MERFPFHRMGAVFLSLMAHIKISTFGRLICKKYLWVEPLLVTAGGCNDGCLLPEAPAASGMGGHQLLQRQTEPSPPALVQRWADFVTCDPYETFLAILGEDKNGSEKAVIFGLTG